MQMIEQFVRNPVKVAVGVLLVMLFGVVALVRMPMQLTPEVQTPTITVETLWPGASPQEVEQEIVIEQEEQLKAVEGVVKMSSESSDSKGTVTLEFGVGTDMDDALIRVNSRLQQVREYPEDAEQPVPTKAGANDRWIAWFMLEARRPSGDELDAFGAKYPQLADKLVSIRKAHNPGLVTYRLRNLAAEHPEFKELLPPADLDVPKLRRFAEDEIEARFERVEGVSQSTVVGGLEDEMQVIVDAEKLAARQITLNDIGNVLRSQNADTSAGDLWEGKRKYVLRVLNQFRSPEQVENQLLAIRDGAPVFVRDVAEVRLGYKKPQGLVRRFGEYGVAINCTRQTGANVLNVMDGLREAVKELNEGLLSRRGLELIQVYDETEYIYSAIDLVTENIYAGSALTMVVLMLCMHLGRRTLLVVPFILATGLAATYISPWFFVPCLALIVVAGAWFARGALVIGLAIPASIIGTFLITHLLGRSLNVISLAGLAFAVGVVVDAANVVLENIDRRISSLGEDPFTAAIRGTQEVWGAVIAANLTTIAVFLPVVFVQEEAGQLFRDIALAISAAVGLSLIVSGVVIPPAAARIYRRSRHQHGHEDESEFDPLDQFAANGGGGKSATNGASDGKAKPTKRRASFIASTLAGMSSRFVDLVVGINRWVLVSLPRQLAVVLVLVAGAAGLSWIFWPAVEYLPTGNRNLVFGMILPPPGYNIDHMMSMGEQLETRLRPYWDFDIDDPKVVNGEIPAIGDMFFVAFGPNIFVGLRALDANRAKDLEPVVMQAGSELPGVFVIAQQSSLFEQGIGGGRTIDVEFTGPQIERLIGMAGPVFGQVMGAMPGAQARPIPNSGLDLTSPELHVKPKLVQAADMQMTSRELGFTLNALVDGAYVGDYYIGGDKIDLTLMGEHRYAQNTQDVAALPIATPRGQLVPLSALADVELSTGPEQINHRERERAITIQVTPPIEMPLETAMELIQKQMVDPLIESGRVESGYHIHLAGTADKLRQTWRSMRFNLLLALVITYLLMAALFESWLPPLVIILSVPLGAVGGILGLWLLNWFVLQTLDVITMLGFVILIGTVVANPILIVHQALNHMREDNMRPREAVLESTRTRIRPIFMTTITTVIGLLPLVLFPGAGSELYRGLGAVVLGGIVVSTVFTLILVPVLFILMLDAREQFGRVILRKSAVAQAPIVVDELPRHRPTVPQAERVYTN
jgi:hydrophobic/amphiphilic exporter-1 (mainly G- bacteria), HAE1 family